MSCNLAVAITKAAVSNDHLVALLDQYQDQVLQLIAQYLHKRFPKFNVQVLQRQIRMGDVALQVKQGEVEAVVRGDETMWAETFTQTVAPFLKVVADQLFAQEVQKVLGSMNGVKLVGKQTSDVENQGVLQRATVYSIEVASLKARVFVLPGGKLQVFVDNGTFSQAKAATLQLIGGIQAQGVALSLTSEVEQHRDDVDHVHVHVHQHHDQQRRG